MIDYETLKKLLKYSAETGEFVWLIDRTGGTKAGDVAGCVNKDGYIVITILHRQYTAHRLAWFYVHGKWTMVDHRDCVGTNNKLTNLREATHSQNCANRRKTAGTLKGTYYKKKDRAWEARIMKDGKSYYLGYFRTEEEAHAAYCAAAAKIHGEFARAA